MNGVNHFLSLMRCNSLPGGKDCWADEFCKVPLTNDASSCKYCKLVYHRRCLSQLSAIDDSCGCHLLHVTANQ